MTKSLQNFLNLFSLLELCYAGKSTLLGVLTQGELDNGRGRARLNLFRHSHEVQTGRTSSISLDFVGFDSQGKVAGGLRNIFNAMKISQIILGEDVVFDKFSPKIVSTFLPRLAHVCFEWI